MNFGPAMISGALLVNAAAILFAASAVTNHRDASGTFLAVVVAPVGLFLLAFGFIEDRVAWPALKRFFTANFVASDKQPPTESSATEPR